MSDLTIIVLGFVVLVLAIGASAVAAAAMDRNNAEEHDEHEGGLTL